MPTCSSPTLLILNRGLSHLKEKLQHEFVANLALLNIKPSVKILKPLS